MTTQNSINIGVTAGGSNVYNFPALTTATLATQNKVMSNVTASRALNGTYSNLSTASSILVMVTADCTVTVGGGYAYMYGKNDTSNPPTTTVTGLVGIKNGLLNEEGAFQLTFVVSTNSNYSVVTSTSNGTCSLGMWTEMTF